MKNSSTAASAKSHFDNPKRDENKDFAEVLDLKSVYSDLQKETNENMSEAQIDYNKKAQIMLDYRRQMFFEHFEKIQRKSYIDLNVK
jgi:hypothetical protein